MYTIFFDSEIYYIVVDRIAAFDRCIALKILSCSTLRLIDQNSLNFEDVAKMSVL